MTGSIADVHMRTDAKNLVTTARTIHLPNQKETIHMIQMLRHEACSGSIQDLAHVASADMMADTLTKSKCENFKFLKASIESGVIPNTDAQPNFRQSIENHHKAFLCEFVCRHINLDIIHDRVLSFLGEDIEHEMDQHLNSLVLRANSCLEKIASTTSVVSCYHLMLDPSVLSDL